MDSLGIDIIEIARVAEAAKNPRFAPRIFTQREIDGFAGHPRRIAEEMAGKFAAKEAVVKTLGRRTIWRDIEILNHPSGKPYVTLHGRSAAIAAGRSVVVSITHSREFAAAVAAYASDE
ncbi:MAG TPA: holo-ACP synthase [Armatimonadota bacterium]